MLTRHIPNIITALNILTGCVGITMAFSGQLHIASFCIILASVFDFLDGFVAKILKAQSPFGKEMDSLADIVSFGVLPATIIFYYLANTLIDHCTVITCFTLIPYLAFIITIFSALRLAKFNIKNDQKDLFQGLPTPANALFISSIPLIIEYSTPGHFLYHVVLSTINSIPALLAIVFISSALMVSPVTMISLKFTSTSFKTNYLKYILVTFSIISLIFFGIAAILLIIIFYIFLSLIHMAIYKFKQETK